MNSDLPLVVGLPTEMKLGSLDFALPSDARSTSVRVQPSNISTVTSPIYSMIGTVSSGLECQFPVQNLIFDLPCGGGGGSQFIDPRFTTLSFRVNTAITTAPNTPLTALAYLRSNANSFFDRSYTVAQNGEYCHKTLPKVGLVY